VTAIQSFFVVKHPQQDHAYNPPYATRENA